MDIRFILDSKGEKTAIIILINEYEDFLYRSHRVLEITDEYKNMIDAILIEEDEQTVSYLTLVDIRKRFKR
ncbi:MAG: hypothetical protein V4577_07170 [Bacteroidota bacterium]